MEAGTSGATYGVIAALEDALSDPALGLGYQTESKTGTQYGRMLKFLHGDDLELVAYPDDWIVVTDAAYDDVNGWVLQPNSRVHVYGRSVGQSGSAVDFVNTFTAAGAMMWDNTATPPTATPLANLSALLTIKQPKSANGPFQYTVTGPGTPGAFGPPDEDGNVSATITGLTEGQVSGPWTVLAKTALYSGANKQATSLPSNTITAVSALPVQEAAPETPMAAPNPMASGAPLPPNAMAGLVAGMGPGGAAARARAAANAAATPRSTFVQ
jgi:hypothetical protein